MPEILSSEFWISGWRRAASGSRFHKVYPDERRIWDLSARTFDSGMCNNDARVQALLKILDNMSFWNGCDKRALDIGSGTGALSIPLARRGVLVDALDNSEQMNNMLRKKCVSADISGINILPVDFHKCGIPENSYDLVLGSLNPCLYQPDCFLKMLSLTRDVLVYIGVAGGGSREKSLAELITGISPGHNGSNHVMYPFNLLLAMGLRPVIDYVPSNWKHEESPEQAISRFISQYEHFRKTQRNMERIIADYVNQRTENGRFIERGDGLIGIVACRKRDVRNG